MYDYNHIEAPMSFESSILEQVSYQEEQEKCQAQKEVRRTQKMLSDLNF